MVGASVMVSVTGSTAADMSGIDHVTTTVTFSQTVGVASVQSSHPIDHQAPTGALDQDPGNVVNATTRQVSGTAQDNIANVTNLGYETVSGAQLVFNGTTGLAYSAITGGSCVSCSGSDWTVTLPDVGVGATVSTTGEYQSVTLMLPA